MFCFVEIYFALLFDGSTLLTPRTQKKKIDLNASIIREWVYLYLYLYLYVVTNYIPARGGGCNASIIREWVYLYLYPCIVTNYIPARGGGYNASIIREWTLNQAQTKGKPR